MVSGSAHVWPNHAFERPRGRQVHGGQRDVAVQDKVPSIGGTDAALRRSTRALGYRVQCQAPAPPLIHTTMNIELPVRFRGSSAAASNSTRDGVPTIEGTVAGRPASQETACVNRHRMNEHKVPRSRASSAGPLRGGVRPSVHAGSSSQHIRLCRCLGGQMQKSFDFLRIPSIKGSCVGKRGAKGLRQLREPLAHGSLTTRSSGV